MPRSISALAAFTAVRALNHIHPELMPRSLDFRPLAALAVALTFLAAGCRDGGSAAQAAAADGSTAAPHRSADSIAPPPTPPPPAPTAAARVPAQIRGIYLNAYAAGSRARLRKLLSYADDTELNTFVVDVKTERGPHYSTQVPLAKELQDPQENTLRNLKAFVDTLHAHRIYAVARVVVFKDPVLSRARPAWSIRQPSGALWVDKAGNTWVSAWDRQVWDYNLDLSEEVARAGFDEIQFDYVRFPEPYRSLPPQVHPEAQGDRTDAIAAFLNEAKRRLHPLGVMVSADVFGLVPNDPRDVNIGQSWETLASISDHIYPMMYPSHYLPTHLPGVPHPDVMPYQVLFKSAGMARIRTDRMKEAGITHPARVIPWLQGFTATWIHPHLNYGAEELRKQKQGAYDVGYDDWVIWHPGSRYEPILAGLAKTTAPHAKQSYTPPADVLATVNSFEKQGVAKARQKAADQARGRTVDPEAAQAAKAGLDTGK